MRRNRYDESVENLVTPHENGFPETRMTKDKDFGGRGPVGVPKDSV